MLAALIAVVAVLSIFMFGGKESTSVWVYQANRNIQPRTELSAKMFTAVQVDPALLVQGAYRAASPEALAQALNLSATRYARYPVARGSQLTRDMVSTPVEIDKPLGPDERLISISVPVANTVAGALKVGDDVDLYAIGQVADKTVAKLVLANAQIVAIGPSTDLIESAATRQATEGQPGATSRSDYLPSDVIPGTYILKVKSSTVGRLALLNKSSALLMAYRAPNATTDIPPVMDLDRALCAPSEVSGGEAPAMPEPDPSTPCGGVG